MTEPTPTREPMSRSMWILLAFAVALLLGVAVSVYRSSAGPPSKEFSANSGARAALGQRGVDPSSLLSYTHYLYFSNQSGAEAAARELGTEFEVSIEPPGGGVVEWAIRARHEAALDSSSLDDLTGRLTQIAERNNGEYDGWEVALDS